MKRQEAQSSQLGRSPPRETQAFLAKYFGLAPRGKDSDHIAFLSDDNGLVLSPTHRRRGRESGVKYPATFHLGFIQENEDRVNELNARLKLDGFDVPPPSRQHGAWIFLLPAPGEFTIEVLC